MNKYVYTRNKRYLIKKIQTTQDEQLLLDATRLMNITINEIDETFELSPRLNKAISEAKGQLAAGDFFSHEDAKHDIDKWLEK
jgi:hypothetical protein